MIISNLPQQTIRQYFRGLTILHFAIAAAMALYMLLTFSAVSKGNFMKDPLMPAMYLYSIPLFAVGSVVAGIYLYKKEINAVKHFKNLALKLKAYRSGFIKRDIFFLGPASFANMAYMLTGAIILLAIAVLLIAAFIYFRPTKGTLIKDLELSTDETIIIQDDDAVIK